MTQAETKLCSLLLQEHFGEIVEKVGVHLINTGSQPLRLITNDTDVPLDQVKKALCVLIQQNLVTYLLHKRGFVEYNTHVDRVLRILRYPRYIYTAKTLYGDTGELVVEELLQNGKMTMSAVVKKVADRLTESMEDGKTMDYSEVSKTFVQLVETHFLQKCPMVPESAAGSEPLAAPVLVTDEKEMYTVPNVSIIGKGKRRRSCEEDDGGQKAKRKKLEEETKEVGVVLSLHSFIESVCCPPVWKSFWDLCPISSRLAWKVGCAWHHWLLVYDLCLKQTSSEIVRTMLRMSEITTSSGAAHTQPLSSNEIFRSLPSGYNISKQILDQYLTLLVDDPMEFVGKAGESGGGMYAINLHKALACLARATLESVVQERFGSRSARIFRLLLRKRHLEQKQVEDFGMIPAKEAKDMMYTLLSENLVSLQEIPKTPDHAPSRTFYLYTVNTLPAAETLLFHSHQTVANLIERRQFETKENKRLLEKSQKIEAILASMQATGAEEVQLQEIEEMITAPERQQLKTLKNNVNKLDTSENQVDETIFVLESYIDSTACKK
nr:PREDICTED: DNA-directed RNA polymerase III subunit RPC3 [Latimeria chalumnae]|eukprot:XP_005991739.1 PREDICTED: DNA-directed RNA polymerase III subunit RPC3 [Latimeria chalumnae]